MKFSLCGLGFQCLSQKGWLNKRGGGRIMIAHKQIAMLSAKATVKKVLDNLPDDCTIHEVMDRLAYIEMIQGRLDALSDPKQETVSQDEVERKVAKWLSRSDG